MRVNWGLHRSFSLLLTCVPAARGGGRSLEVLCAETVSRAPPSGNVQHDRWLTEDPEPGFPQLRRGPEDSGSRGGGLEGWGISVLTIQSLVSLSYFFCYICEEKKLSSL